MLSLRRFITFHWAKYTTNHIATLALDVAAHIMSDHTLAKYFNKIIPVVNNGND